MNSITLKPGIGDNRPTAKLYYGQDVREILRTLPEASVHTVCTSPPYFGLRDYGKDGQIGLEKTPEGYVAAMVDVFREVRRVLREDGTLWLNIGDSYNNNPSTSEIPRHPQGNGSGAFQIPGEYQVQARRAEPNKAQPLIDAGIKKKDLIGIPWMLAFALRADGWYLRQDIIWHKPNPMPESVTDRCTKAHEYLFLFAHPDSGGQYFYDHEAIKEDSEVNRTGELGRAVRKRNHGGRTDGYTVASGTVGDGLTRNRRSVWSITKNSYLGSHFATWPPELVRPMILAGTSGHGVCSDCGAPWNRKALTSSVAPKDVSTGGYPGRGDGGTRTKDPSGGGGNVLATVRTWSGDWEPTCDCVDARRVPATVLDPFSGSATTGMVALREGRNYVGIDLNPDYLNLAINRVQEHPAPQPDAPVEDGSTVFDLFGDAE